MALTIPVTEIVEKSKNPLLGKHETWARVRLGDIATIQNGYAFESSQFTKDEGIPLIRIRDVGKDQTDTKYVGKYDPDYVVEHGDLLVGMDGDFNCARWTGPTSLLNQRVCRIKLTSDIYLPKLIDYALPGYLKAINDVTSSVTVKHLSSKSIAEIPLPLPPKDQQILIVDEIEKQFSRLDKAVAGLKRIKANLKRYKASVLKAAVEGKLTAEWRKAHPNVETGAKLLKRILAERKKKWEEKNPGKKYKEPVAPDTSSLPKLPEGWVWVSLQQVFETITDGDHQPPPQTESGIPFLVIGNVRTGKINFLDTRFVSRDYFENIVDVRIPRKGDILYTVVGSYGIPVLIDTDNIFCVQRHIAILKPMNLVERRYLYYILKTNFVFSQATKCATGTAQKTVPLSGLRTISIPFPSSKEQEIILEELESRLSVTEEIEAAIEINMKRADRLRQSILEQAFSGRNIDRQSK